MFRRLSRTALHRTRAWTSRRLFSSFHERIVSVQLQDKGLTIQWSSNRTSQLPYLYLRDNCQEPESMESSARQRLFNPAFSVDLNIQAKQAHTSEDGQQLCLTWPDGHRSRFPSFWLMEHSDGTNETSSRLPVEQRLWKSDSYVGRFDFHTLMNDDGSLLEFILHLGSCGVALVENVGTAVNEVTRFCGRISFPRPSVYGYDVTRVEAKPDPTNLAYTGLSLLLHTDLPCYGYVPGIQLLHCIEQPPDTAGMSHFCDGFSVASKLRDTNPAAFHMLSQYAIQYVDAGKDFLDFSMESWHTPIKLNRIGEITAIYFNNHVRGSRYPASLNGRLLEWYEAYYAFSRLMYTPEFLIEFKLEPGQMVVVDNQRMLHGRSGFVLEDGHYRYLEVAYLDWDETRSKARVLKAKINADSNVEQ